MRFSTYSDLKLCVYFPNKFNENLPGRCIGHPRNSEVALRVLSPICSAEQKFSLILDNDQLDTHFIYFTIRLL